MPLPPHIISAGAFLCEKLLHERDGILSAIRIVDVFYVPPNLPEERVAIVQANCVLILKAEPRHDEEHELDFKILNPIGELESIGPPLRQRLQSRLGLDLPTALTVNAQLNISPKRLGTYFVCVYLDGEEVARTPFTLMSRPTQDAEQH